MTTPLDRLAASRPLQLLVAVLGGLGLLSTLVWIASVRSLVDGFHQPFGGDFIIFYATAKLTLAGHPWQAFDPHALLAAEQSVIPGVRPGLWWCYPPPYRILVAPFGLLPFVPAYVAFEALTAAPYLLLLRRLAGKRRGWWMAALAFSGSFVNAWQGQNAFLTAALLGWGLLLVDTRPLLGGLLLGLLVYKPQFAVLAPLVLVGTGRWRAVAGAALSAGATVALSTLAWGVEDWRLFLITLPQVSHNVWDGALSWSKMPSTTVALLSLGAPHPLVALGQGAVSLAAAVLTLRCWRGRARHELKVAVSILGALLVSPYVFNYDLALLSLPGFVMLATAETRGRLVVDAVVLTAALLPYMVVPLARLTHAQPGALAIAAAFLAILRVAATETGAGAAAHPPDAADTRPSAPRLQPC